MRAEIQPIRQAARQLVRELNLLDGRYCIEGFTYSECHLLTELEAMGQATAVELGERLVLEKSTMSRLINGLLSKGLIDSDPDPADGRKRLLSLTKKGKSGVERINRYSNDQVNCALDFVTPGDRERVVTGLDRYAKALKYARMARAFSVRPMHRKEAPTVARIIRQVMTEYGVAGQGFSSEDPEIDDMYSAYADSRFAYFVVVRDGCVVGCGGMGPLQGASDDVCEIRKMYLLPESRGYGLGTRLLATILDAARSAAYTSCYLETLESMSHARHLYLKYGFTPISKPMGNTGHCGCNQYMSLAL